MVSVTKKLAVRRRPVAEVFRACERGRAGLSLSS